MKRIILITAGVIVLTISTVILWASFREMFHTNKGKSISTGYRSNGTLTNAWLMPYSGKNFKYFSFISYYLADNAYVNDKVCRAVTEAYKICETTSPGIEFRLMEGSNYEGGPMVWHRTHQTGVSIDFMIPKSRNGKQFTLLDHWGYLHYLLSFDDEGKLKPQHNIPVISKLLNSMTDGSMLDFESSASHILALDDACKKEGVSIRKVIIKLEYKEKLFKTPAGKKLLARGIPFATRISKITNALHDDHYHIDFKVN